MGGKGSGKKKGVACFDKECGKKMVTKYRCHIPGQSTDFNNQADARAMAMSLLQTGEVFFLELSKVEVEDKDC